MFEGLADQAAGLRKLIHADRPPLVPVGSLIPMTSAQPFMQRFIDGLVRDAQPGDAAGDARLNRLVDLPGLYDVLDGSSPATGASARLQGGDVSGDEASKTERLFWLDEPVAMARWVHAQGGDRLMLLLSHRRDSMMAQYAEIKRIAATTGIRRFGVLFADVDQARQGRQSFLNLAGCSRRFLSVQLDVVVGSCRDESVLTMWSGLSTSELSAFEWTSWSEVGMPLPQAVKQGVTH